MPPTFLFLLYKIIKEQTISKTVENSTRLTLHPNLNHQNHSVPTLNLVCARLQQCGLSRSHRLMCQPIFFKKFTTLSVIPLSTHQPGFHPTNAADLIKSNTKVKLFQPTTRTKHSAASSVAALVESHIDPTQQNCQRTFTKLYKISFHRETARQSRPAHSLAKAFCQSTHPYTNSLYNVRSSLCLHHR